MAQEELEERLSAIEDRLAILEARLAGQRSTGAVETSVSVSPSQSPVPANRSRTVVGLALVSKRFDASDYQEHIWMDLALTLAADSRPTRAVKGTLAFCDLFGEPQFQIGYTINDPLRPGVPFSAKGVGFEYNQFMSEHQWMLGTEIHDMRVYFDVRQIIFQDGSTESF